MTDQIIRRHFLGFAGVSSGKTQTLLPLMRAVREQQKPQSQATKTKK